jgi:hypothetical protein
MYSMVCFIIWKYPSDILDLIPCASTLLLNASLSSSHRFKTSECECGAGKETVEHFLLNCELYDEERDKLRRKVGAQGMRTSVLLGYSTTIKDTIEYIENTG